MALKIEVGQAEWCQFFDALQPHFLQYCATGRPLCGQAGYIVGVLHDIHIEAHGVGQEPVDLVFLGANSVYTLAQVKNRAVVDHLSVVIAPDAVTDAAGLDLTHIPCHQAVEVGQGVGAGDKVLDHGRNIEHATGVAPGEILHRLTPISWH